jgi:hypothetical protein
MTLLLYSRWTIVFLWWTDLCLDFFITNLDIQNNWIINPIGHGKLDKAIKRNESEIRYDPPPTGCWALFHSVW